MAKKKKLNKRISINRETLLAILKTSNLLMKASGRFFSRFVITDVQFNILMILKDEPQGLNQQELSKKLVVTKSNVVGLIDRMEKTGLVERQEHPTDRRCHTVALTKTGLQMLSGVEEEYFDEVDRIMSVVDTNSKKNLIMTGKKLEVSLSREPQ